MKIVVLFCITYTLRHNIEKYRDFFYVIFQSNKKLEPR